VFSSAARLCLASAFALAALLAAASCTELTGITDFRVSTTLSGSGGNSTTNTATGGADDGCSNGKQDGVETDIDCGGPCKSCELGKACQVDDDCTGKHCANNVCCDAACQEACYWCLGSKTGGEDGVCAPATAGTDPGDDCQDKGALSCGTDGYCDGDGGCRFYPAKTVCGNSSCKTSTIQAGPDQCDGMGACASVQDSSCLPYICSPDACKTSCASEIDCATNNYCDDQSKTCLAKKPDGNSCENDDECSNDVCKLKKCRPAHCDNQMTDGGETDLDCGGTCGATCGSGDTCATNNDCDPNFQCTSFTCQ